MDTLKDIIALKGLHPVAVLPGGWQGREKEARASSNANVRQGRSWTPRHQELSSTPRKVGL